MTFDREHHERITIHWDRVATSTETVAEDADALAQALNAGGVPPAADAAPPAARADPLDRLAKLADLHSSGALTDAEFASQKAKILASM